MGDAIVPVTQLKRLALHAFKMPRRNVQLYPEREQQRSASAKHALESQRTLASYASLTVQESDLHAKVNVRIMECTVILTLNVS